MTTELLNSYLLTLYPVAAVSSQSILDLTTILMFFVTLWLIRKNPQKFVLKKIGIEWAFLGYGVVVALGFLFNASKDAEWVRSAIKFSWLLNIYILIYTFQSLKISSAFILKALTLLSIGPTIYSLISYVHGLDLITGRSNIRITGLVNSATYHAHGNAFLLIFMLGSLIVCHKKLSYFWKYFGGFSIGLLGLSIALTFTRGIWGSLFLSSLIVLGYFDWKKVIRFFSVSIVVAGLGLFFWPKFNERVVGTLNSSGDSQRLDLFWVNVQMWKEHPLLGIGYGENLRRNREYWDRPEWNRPADFITSHAHNQYLNVIATTGIFGLIFFCWFFFFFLVKNYQLLKNTDRDRYPERFAFLVIALWAQWQFILACLTDVSFEYAKIRALILLVWALVIALDQKPSIVRELGHV